MTRSLFSRWLLPVFLCATPLAAWAGHDDDDDDRGRRHRHDHHQRGEYKEEFWDGRCKVEREWKRNGAYKEKRKCKERPLAYYRPPEQFYAPAVPGAIVISPQLVIRP